MSSVEGNAWAQMKAREREQQLANPKQGQMIQSTGLSTDPQSSSAASTFSGLDYDSEVALPMPTARQIPPPPTPPVGPPFSTVSPSTPKLKLLGRPNVSKKISTTDPALPSDAGSSSSKTDYHGKKKSKVASLRSKFSLKDIGKESHKESFPSLSTMPNLKGNEMAKYLANTESPGHTESKPHNFSQERLYYPKEKEEGVCPASAPLTQTSSFHDSSNLDKSSRGRDEICKSAKEPSTTVVKNQLAKGVGSQSTPAYKSILNTMLLDSSSSTGRTGECDNTGQPELIQVKTRVRSMTAQSDHVEWKAPNTSPPHDRDPYSPSIYESPIEPLDKPPDASLYCSNDVEIKKPRPLIVSSSIRKRPLSGEQDEEILDLMSQEPPHLPEKAKSREGNSHADSHVLFHGSRFFADTTSYGGYAPTPPHPGYQSTATLEHQFLTHVDALHYHLNNAFQQLSDRFENSNNRAVDQVLRHVDTISNMTNMINDRAMAQTEVVKELQQSMKDIRVQLQIAYEKEENLKVFFQQEVNKLREELLEVKVNARNPSFHHAGYTNPLSDASCGAQFSHKSTKGNVDSKNLQSKRHPQAEQDAEGNHYEHTQSARQERKVSQRENQLGGALKATSTTQDRNGKIPINHHPQKTARWNSPLQESSGSPESKLTKIRSAKSPVFVAPSEERGPELGPMSECELESKPPCPSIPGYKLQTPQKKGSMFNFRRLDDRGDTHAGNRPTQTPQKSQEKGSKSPGQSPLLPPVIPLHPGKTKESPIRPPALSINMANPLAASFSHSSSAAQLNRKPSPSMIHPALRSPCQRQGILERELESVKDPNRQQVDSPQEKEGSNSKANSDPLRFCRSPYEFGSNSSIASSTLVPGWQHPANTVTGPFDQRAIHVRLPPTQAKRSGRFPQSQFYSDCGIPRGIRPGPADHRVPHSGRGPWLPPPPVHPSTLTHTPKHFDGQQHDSHGFRNNTPPENGNRPTQAT